MDRLSAFQGGVSIFSSFIKSFQPLSAFSFCYIKENSICIHGYFLFAGYNKYKEKWQKGAVENVVSVVFSNWGHGPFRKYCYWKAAPARSPGAGLTLPADHSVPCFDPGVEIVRGDVRDLESLVPFFAHKIDQELVVIHTAGIVSISSKYQQRLYDVNVKGLKIS